MLFIVISITLLSVLAANAQVIVPGRCPKPAVQENFDAAKTKCEITQLPLKIQHHYLILYTRPAVKHTFFPASLNKC
uniref:Chemokine interleukin-8-like domain-containing protein n=1 Tax=Seriola lalandi dorsalis TaxID=1841481 RepID=A0A3B4XRS0_SERLL